MLAQDDEQTIDQVWIPSTLHAQDDEQTIDQVWMPPTLPVQTDEQTISSLRVNFAWDKRVFIGRQRAAAACAEQGTAPPPPSPRLALGAPIESAHNTIDQKAAMVNGVVRDFRNCVTS